MLNYNEFPANLQACEIDQDAISTFKAIKEHDKSLSVPELSGQLKHYSGQQGCQVFFKLILNRKPGLTCQISRAVIDFFHRSQLRLPVTSSELDILEAIQQGRIGVYQQLECLGPKIVIKTLTVKPV